MVVESYFYHSYNEFWNFTFRIGRALDNQLRMAMTSQSFNFVFSGRGTFIYIFLKKIIEKLYRNCIGALANELYSRDNVDFIIDFLFVGCIWLSSVERPGG